MNELLPCPFCGGEAFVNDDPTGNGGKPHMSGNVGLGRLWSVECDECGADAGFWQDRDVAIAAWNTRAELGSEPPYDELLRCLENDWHIRASWDGLRKFWCIELTEEGVELRDAAHSTLTAEQIRKAVEGHGNIMDNRLYEDWQAVADELNAELESVKDGV